MDGSLRPATRSSSCDFPEGCWPEDGCRWLWVAPELARTIESQGAVEGQPWAFGPAIIPWRRAKNDPTPWAIEIARRRLELIPQPNRAGRRAFAALVRRAGPV